MGLADPTFLVPSTDFHKLAAPILRDGVWRFSMAASMEPKNLKRTHAVPMPPEGVLSAPGVILVGSRERH